MTYRAGNRLSPEFALLGFLYQAPSHGYELHQRLRDQFGYIWNASQSQTYNILNRLESQGYVRATFVEQEKLPARQQVQLTASGRDRFETWLRQPTKTSVHAIRVEFITRLHFCQCYFPGQLQGIIHDQIEAVKTDAEALQQALGNSGEIQPYNRLALELRLEILASVLHWLEGCGQLYKLANSESGENA
jgi:DNA-binding PadR family transcriptional regulator